MIPQRLRDQLGLRAGPVDVIADGAGVRVEPLTADSSLEEGRLVIPASGTVVDDDMVRSLRDADQR